MTNSARRSTPVIQTGPRQVLCFLIVIAGLALLAALPARAQNVTVLHNFTGGADGGQPVAGLTLDRSRNLYGTAYYGGNLRDCSGGCGVVYKSRYTARHGR